MPKKFEVDLRGRETYRQALDGSPQVPLWQQPWWLDATAGDEWQALCLLEGDRVVAALPYVARKRSGFTIWTQPLLTQSLGPWLSNLRGSYEARLSREHTLLSSLVEAIPRDLVYLQNWQTSTTNWLPFYWAGFHQEMRYTYRLDLRAGRTALWDGLSGRTRNAVSKAASRFGVIAERTTGVGELLRMTEQVFSRQGSSTPPWPQHLVQRVFDAASARGAAEVWHASDCEARVCAGALIVRDASTAYYLIGGADPELRASGAQNLVVWESLLAQIEHCKTFDFEGSMVPGIERSFRSYGAVQVPYSNVFGSHRPILSAAALGWQWVRRTKLARASAT